MSKKCMVMTDYFGAGGIHLKRGTVCEVLGEETDYVWIYTYIEEAGEDLPFPVFKCYIKFL